jgi:hypothetical protein
MSPTPVTILREFKHNLIQFFDELIEQFPHESHLVLARIFLKDRIPIEHVMQQFIQTILPLKPVISIRDEKFILEGRLTFLEQADANTVNHFKTLWKSNQLDDEDKQVIWQWLDQFILLAERYQAALPPGSKAPRDCVPQASRS